jgi:hypothetical protein
MDNTTTTTDQAQAIDASHTMRTEYGYTYCAKCGATELSTDTDDNLLLETECLEEPYHNPGDAGDAWTGGFAENH